MWEIGDRVYVGWPDHGRPPRSYQVIEVDRSGPVVRARVSDESGKQGGFLVVYDCPDNALETLASKATDALGFEVAASGLRCSIDGTILRSFDYEWWPTPEFAGRPRFIVEAVAKALEEMRERGEV